MQLNEVLYIIKQGRLIALLAKLQQQHMHFNVVSGCRPAGLCLTLRTCP